MELNSQNEDMSINNYLEQYSSFPITQYSVQDYDQSSPVQFQKKIEEELVEEEFRDVINKVKQFHIPFSEELKILRKFRRRSGPQKQVQNLVLLKKLLHRYQNSQKMLSHILEEVDFVLILNTSIKFQTKKQVRKQIFNILLFVTQRTHNLIYEHFVKENLGTVNKVVKYLFDSPQKIFNKLALAISYRLLAEQKKIPFVNFFFCKKLLTRVFQLTEQLKIEHHNKILIEIIYETTNHQTDFCCKKVSHIYFCEKQMIKILRFLVKSFKKQNADFFNLNIIKNNCLQLLEYHESKEFLFQHKKLFLQLLDISKHFFEEFKLTFKTLLYFDLLSCSQILSYLQIYGIILDNQYQETICVDIDILSLITHQKEKFQTKFLQALERILTRLLEILINRAEYDSYLGFFQNLVESINKVLVEKNYKQIAEMCVEISNIFEKKKTKKAMKFIIELFNPALLNFYRQKMGKDLSPTQTLQIIERYYKNLDIDNISKIKAESKK